MVILSSRNLAVLGQRKNPWPNFMAGDGTNHMESPGMMIQVMIPTRHRLALSLTIGGSLKKAL